jgi:hypothetical protein
MLQVALGRADVAVPTESASVRELVIAGRNRSLPREIVGIDPHPPPPHERLGLGLRSAGAARAKVAGTRPDHETTDLTL